MMAVAAMRLFVNLISMRILSSGKDSSLNMKGAYLEVWSDMLGSVGVIAAALIIKFSGWTCVDALVAMGIGLWVLPRTWQLLKESMNILLEGVPDAAIAAIMIKLADQFKVFHTTLQLEIKPCEHTEDGCNFIEPRPLLAAASRAVVDEDS